MIKVLCLGSINASNATFKQALNAGMQVEWGTAEDVQEAKTVEQFYDYTVVADGIKYRSPKYISLRKLIKLQGE